MLSRLVLRSSRGLLSEPGCSRSIVTEVQHASTSTSIVDDSPGRPSRQPGQLRRSKPRDVLPHDPRRAVRDGKVGFGSSSGSVPDKPRPKSNGSSSKPRSMRTATEGTRVPRTENPFVLGPRIVEVYKKKGADKAIAELATSKKEARTVAVSNMLIKMLLNDGLVELAYKVWMNMKRIGLTPTPMSYTVFFSSVNPRQLRGKLGEKVQTIWKQWQNYCEKASDPADPLHQLAETDEYKITSIPTNAYLSLLHKAGIQSDAAQLSTAIDEILDMKGFKPTKETFTVIFRSITSILETSSTTSNSPRVNECYTLCRKAWSILYENAGTEGLTLDGRAVSCAAIVYRQLFVINPSIFSQDDKRVLLQKFEILLALQDPESEAAGVRPIKADSNVIYDAMVLASLFEGRYSRHVLDWFSRLQTEQSELIDARMCELYMRASPKTALETLVYMLRTPSATIRPTLSTYTTAMSLQPFIDQVRTLAHMTGRNDLLEPSETSLLQATSPTPAKQTKVSKRALEKGYHTKHLEPTSKMMVILLQSALDLQDWRRIDRALNLVDTFGFVTVKSGEETAVGRGKSTNYDSRLKDLITQAGNKLIDNPAVPASRKQEIRDRLRSQEPEMKPRLVRSASRLQRTL